MIQCRSCAADNPDESKFCSECGAALSDEYAPTEIPVSSHESSLVSTPSDSHHGRFLPGAKVADRYRIVSLVGKGGMGEVYRADDLKLGHTVALKFLPRDLADDPKRLEYFHNEVRLTRQISHPNVCRVYDIGESDGQLFLSMEYIDGEDLRLLLRRIGRLPPDKGVQIAQQLCAGLAAAHEKGVLHRDLKPANIMLDGRGQVRITDFGLAKLADDGTEGEIAGTPAYMAPEQLFGGQVTIQSDLYSLGLILYELFTGRPARKTNSLPELMQANAESTLSQTLELPIDIDPVVQRAILRCLEQAPQERPLSAIAVAASLPGGDPLAAALAAGETPSPEMVAAAGKSGLLSLRTAAIYLGVVIVGLGLLVWRGGKASPTRQIDSSAVEIARQARGLLEELGHLSPNNPAAYESYQFILSKETSPQKEAKTNEEGAERKVLEFWYRSSPSDLFLEGNIEEIFKQRTNVTLTSPPPLIEGMCSVLLDRDQNLRELFVVSPLKRSRPERLTDIQDDELFAKKHSELASLYRQAGLLTTDLQNFDPPPDFDRLELSERRQRELKSLFAQAGLMQMTVEELRQSLEKSDVGKQDQAYEIGPPFHVDEFFVFQMKNPEQEDSAETTGHRIAWIELGYAEGRIAYFKAVQPSIERIHVSPWEQAPDPVPSWAVFPEKTQQYEPEGLKEKKRHVDSLRKQVRGQHEGGIKSYLQLISWTVSLFILPTTMVLAWRNITLGRSDRRTAWRLAVFLFFVTLLSTRLNFGMTLELLRASLKLSAGVAFQFWVYYLALEPIVRKFWPGILTAWSRAMTGRWRDPSLGHSLLMGAMMATLVPLLYYGLVGLSAEFKVSALSGNIALLAQFLELIRFVAGWGVYIIIILVLCRMVVPNDWLAAVVASVLLMVFWFFKFVAQPDPFTFVVMVYFATLMFFLIRLGAVAAFSFLFCHHLLVWMPLSDDLKGPDLAPTVLAVVVVLAFAGWGFYTSVGGRFAFEKPREGLGATG